MPHPLEEKLNLMSYDLALTLTFHQGPARAVQLIGMACHELADSAETLEIRKNLAEIGDVLERYAATVLEHMGQAKT